MVRAKCVSFKSKNTKILKLKYPTTCHMLLIMDKGFETKVLLQTHQHCGYMSMILAKPLAFMELTKFLIGLVKVYYKFSSDVQIMRNFDK